MYDKDGNLIHAIVTRHSKEVHNGNLRFKECLVDKRIRDKFIKDTGDVLSEGKMKFWSLPENYLQLQLPPTVF